eukprot:scaffold23272_cov58-Skeletonema_marinoi.AAC.1
MKVSKTVWKKALTMVARRAEMKAQPMVEMMVATKARMKAQTKARMKAEQTVPMMVELKWRALNSVEKTAEMRVHY